VIDAHTLSELLTKYNGHAPRYTSYPTALHFNEDFDSSCYNEQVLLSNQQIVPRPLSLYVHIPFCASLCYYCGCNKVVTRNTERAAKYIELLGQEIAQRAPLFESDRLVQQIHFGGGTPTFLSPSQLKEILELIAQSFHLGLPHTLEMGIEIDPRSVTVEELEQLVEIGFNRFSFGIQDTNEDVQEAVNRIQPFSNVKALVQRARELGVESISFDLIYGLPRQTRESFDETLREVISAKPDRLALYNYAHLPDKMPAQRLIKKEDLPQGYTKLSILSDSIIELTKAGYEYIGMDHFALPGDSLAKAQREGSLQRNFQGYSTHAEADLIGIGVSAISRVNESYCQNEVDLKAYEARVNAGEHPMAKGLLMSRDDVIRADLIQRLMCGERVKFHEFSAEHGIYFHGYFQQELEELAPLVKDGLVNIDSEGFNVSPLGRIFLRNIALCFDHYMKPSSQSRDSELTLRYSSTI